MVVLPSYCCFHCSQLPFEFQKTKHRDESHKVPLPPVSQLCGLSLFVAQRVKYIPKILTIQHGFACGGVLKQLLKRCPWNFYQVRAWDVLFPGSRWRHTSPIPGDVRLLALCWLREVWDMVALGCAGSAVSLGLICSFLRVLISCPQSRWALSWGCHLARSPKPGVAPSLSPPAPSRKNALDTPYASREHQASVQVKSSWE